MRKMSFYQHVMVFGVHTQRAPANINTAADLILQYGDIVPAEAVEDQPWHMQWVMERFGYRQDGCGGDWKSFPGGPRAWYCPDCRKKRQQEQNQAYKVRRRRGITRQIGGTDYCAVCCTAYIVDGANQRYCKKCAGAETAKTAREQSLAYYRREKDQINPERHEKRRKQERICKHCGKQFEGYGKGYYCSDECRKNARRLSYAKADAKRMPRIREYSGKDRQNSDLR